MQWEVLVDSAGIIINYNMDIIYGVNHCLSLTTNDFPQKVAR